MRRTSTRCRGWTATKKQGAPEARGDGLPDWLSRRSGRPTRSRSTRRRTRTTCSRPTRPSRAPDGEDRPPRRPRRVGHVARRCERVLRPAAQPHGVPRGHPADAVLQGRRLDPGEPRRHGHGRRPRAHARLRRPGRAVRRRGNLKDWWQPETEKLFKQRTQCVVDQYSNYEIAGATSSTARTRPARTSPTSAASSSRSPRIARCARRRADTVVADGFTEDQQFFLGFGQAWCAKARPDFEKLLVDGRRRTRPRSGASTARSRDTPDFAKAFRARPARRCTRRTPASSGNDVGRAAAALW